MTYKTRNYSKRMRLSYPIISICRESGDRQCNVFLVWWEENEKEYKEHKDWWLFLLSLLFHGTETFTFCGVSKYQERENQFQQPNSQSCFLQTSHAQTPVSRSTDFLIQLQDLHFTGWQLPWATFTSPNGTDRGQINWPLSSSFASTVIHESALATCIQLAPKAIALHVTRKLSKPGIKSCSGKWKFDILTTVS